MAAYLNCMALTGFTFLINSVGIIKVAKDTARVARHISKTCHQTTSACAALI
jgi:hypothetical protein